MNSYFTDRVFPRWRKRGGRILLFAGICLACIHDASAQTNWVPLRDVANRGSLTSVGAAVKYTAFQSDAEYRSLLVREYNMLVPENELKWLTLRTDENTYAFKKADEVVDFAVSNRLDVRGHTLCWNIDKYLPRWVTNATRTPDEASALLRNHIRTVMGHYKGRIKFWDVVNESVSNSTNGQILTDGYWKRMLGDEYIDLAFKWAHEADPSAQLFYNDYDKGDSMGRKSDKIYHLMKRLVERGVPIHGVGLQMHCNLAKPPVEADVRANLARLTKLGLNVQITELDVDIDDVPGTLEERLQAQAKIYGMVARVAAANPKCTALVTWGVTDRWGNTNKNKLKGKPEDAPTYLLPFDASYQPKPAAFSLAEALRGKHTSHTALR